MWERSARQNPLSARYQFNRDTRPYLPQDKTTDWLSGRYSDLALIYYVFISNRQRRILLSNNIPSGDRVKLQKMVDQHEHLMKKTKWMALIPSCVLAGFLFKQVSFRFKIFYPLFFGLTWFLSNNFIQAQFANLFNDNVSYYYYKYMHMTKSEYAEIEDPRRKFFRLDTSVYYRQTAEEILHGGHGHDAGHGGHGGHGGHEHHDTSTYYGPYPVIYILD
jgi:hypothetical protein